MNLDTASAIGIEREYIDETSPSFNDEESLSFSEEYDSEEYSEEYNSESDKDERDVLQNIDSTSTSTAKESCMFERGEEIMFETTKITVNDVVQMIVAFGVRFGSTHEQRDNLFEMFKICASSKFQHIKLSNYKISKICDPPPDKIVYHFYCEQCSQKKEVLQSCIKSKIKDSKVICSSCKKTHIIGLSNPNYFLSVDIEYQLQLLFQEKEVAEILIRKLTNDVVESSDSVIRDVDDSILHKALVKSDNNILTLTISTDGAPLFKMSKRSFWPYQLILNFLPPRLRFKYVLLAGIMIVNKEPNPDLLNLFVNELNNRTRHLYSEGLKLKLQNDDREIIVKFAPLCVVADSAARPVLQNRIKYNGYFSCCYCYHNGYYVPDAGIRFPFLNVEPKLRTHDSHLKDVADVEKLLSSKLKKNVTPAVRGVKGSSAYISENNIDMIWGFPIDYMHNAILGVAEQIWEHINKNDLSPQQRDEVDELLLQIQPPHDLYRIPEKISTKKVWKATNWKSWLLYYSLPILSKFVLSISKEKIEHYALFVISIHTLLKVEITEEELIQCEKYLLIFVGKFQIFYGIEKMTFNVHILLHLVRSVRMTGPLWATSAFPFERNIFSLKNLVNGTKSIEHQIATKSLNKIAYQVAPLNPHLANNVVEYCKNIFSTKTHTKSSVTFENITFFSPSSKNKFQIEQEFERCIHDHTIFCSTKYLKSKKFNDTVVLLRNKKIVQITRITLMPNIECRLEVVELIVEPFAIGDIQIYHICKVIKNIEHASITLSEIESKMVVLDLKNIQQFVCVVCNNIEAQ